MSHGDFAHISHPCPFRSIFMRRGASRERAVTFRCDVEGLMNGWDEEQSFSSFAVLFFSSFSHFRPCLFPSFHHISICPYLPLIISANSQENMPLKDPTRNQKDQERPRNSATAGVKRGHPRSPSRWKHHVTVDTHCYPSNPTSFGLEQNAVGRGLAVFGSFPFALWARAGLWGRALWAPLDPLVITAPVPWLAWGAPSCCFLLRVCTLRVVRQVQSASPGRP